MTDVVSGRKLVSDAAALVLVKQEELYCRYEILVTDIKVDLTLAFATIRVEGAGFERGTAIRIFMTSHVWEDAKLVVEWDNRKDKAFFRPTDKNIKKINYLLSITLPAKV